MPANGRWDLIRRLNINAMIQDPFGFPAEDVWHTSQTSPLTDNKVTVEQK